MKNNRTLIALLAVTLVLLLALVALIVFILGQGSPVDRNPTGLDSSTSSRASNRGLLATTRSRSSGRTVNT
ncbi:hypothetical protein BKA04_000547 [Cryobacterium mesophilum]|uniref:Uncharacterized protein n=1 Tax=Terrimesophilobacter mesophilus TaxID=433647 RepID=A0A4R8V9Z2_9MICO|nr:hypothetical protein [Terrimesophilobacter mesophilus]MBB5632324.1 hypothetical protein [Terrimesophilobacter mesophilus]TFB79166.1 hypothetical protein E3N84_03305 [Terrimesophilobacter mesophilus]